MGGGEREVNGNKSSSVNEENSPDKSLSRKNRRVASKKAAELALRRRQVAAASTSDAGRHFDIDCIRSSRSRSTNSAFLPSVFF